MSTHIKLVGMDKLQRKLKRNASMIDVKEVVKTNGVRLERAIKANTKEAFVRGYSEGYTADSVSGQISDGGLTYTAGEGMEYDPYVEYGTRFMEAEPTVTPAAEEVFRQFKRDLDKLTR